jgi:DNA-binding LacI/PurR family transcriptional regulator
MNLPNEEESSHGAGEAESGVSKIPKQLGGLQKTITMAQIAKAAGVSQGAISSLLNDRDYGIRVSEKTRERVFKVCREMGYIPNDLRAVVRMYPEVGDFCLLMASRPDAGTPDPLASRLITAAMESVPDDAHPLTLANYETKTNYRAGNATLPHPLRSGVCSKFIIYGPPNPSLYEIFVERGIPAVSLGHEVAAPGVLSLLFDYSLASRMAVSHLFQLGHQRLGIVSGPFGSTEPKILDFNRGVLLAHEERNLPIEGQNIIQGDLSIRAGHAALDELLSRNPRPTAIFCMSDTAAIGVLFQAQARGIKVPEELSIIGCSDDPNLLWTNPQLTTVHLPAEEMAELGVKEISRMVGQDEPQAARKTFLPARLVERGSCVAI